MKMRMLTVFQGKKFDKSKLSQISFLLFKTSAKEERGICSCLWSGECCHGFTQGSWTLWLGPLDWSWLGQLSTFFIDCGRKEEWYFRSGLVIHSIQGLDMSWRYSHAVFVFALVVSPVVLSWQIKGITYNYHQPLSQERWPTRPNLQLKSTSSVISTNHSSLNSRIYGLFLTIYSWLANQSEIDQNQNWDNTHQSS